MIVYNTCMMRCGKQQTTQNEESGRVVALQRGTAMVFGQNLPKNSAAEPLIFSTCYNYDYDRKKMYLHIYTRYKYHAKPQAKYNSLMHMFVFVY